MKVTISDLFCLESAKSHGIGDYEPGNTPFVTSSELNNGVVAYVEPIPGDRVFDGPAICISGLGHATFHPRSFLAKGNGGDACTILLPREEACSSMLLYQAALFNVLHKWRFSYGRKANKRRLSNLKLSPLYLAGLIDYAEEIARNNKLMVDLLVEKEMAV